jgi:hypothetical protein
MSAKLLANDMAAKRLRFFFTICDDGAVLALAIDTDRGLLPNDVCRSEGIPVDTARSDNGEVWAFVVRVDPANPKVQSKEAVQQFFGDILLRLDEAGYDCTSPKVGVRWRTLADFFAGFRPPDEGKQ